MGPVARNSTPRAASAEAEDPPSDVNGGSRRRVTLSLPPGSTGLARSPSIADGAAGEPKAAPADNRHRLPGAPSKKKKGHAGLAGRRPPPLLIPGSLLAAASPKLARTSSAAVPTPMFHDISESMRASLSMRASFTPPVPVSARKPLSRPSTAPPPRTAELDMSMWRGQHHGPPPKPPPRPQPLLAPVVVSASSLPRPKDEALWRKLQGA